MLYSKHWSGESFLLFTYTENERSPSSLSPTISLPMENKSAIFYVIYLATDFVGVRKGQTWEIIGGKMSCPYPIVGQVYDLHLTESASIWRLREPEMHDLVWADGSHAREQITIGNLGSCSLGLSPFHQNSLFTEAGLLVLSLLKCITVHVTFPDDPFLTSLFSRIYSSLVALEHVHFSLLQPLWHSFVCTAQLLI